MTKYTILCIPYSPKICSNIKQFERHFSLKQHDITYALSKSGMYIQENGKWYDIQTKCISHSELQIKNNPLYANYLSENKRIVFYLPLDTHIIHKSIYRFQNDILELNIEERNDQYHKNPFPNQYKQEKKWNIYLKLNRDYHDLNIKEINEISRVLSLINYI